jgi:hypothetical protein
MGFSQILPFRKGTNSFDFSLSKKGTSYKSEEVDIALTTQNAMFVAVELERDDRVRPCR